MNFERALAIAISQPIDSSLVTFPDHSQWDSEHSLQHSDYYHRSTNNETVRPAHL
jgi:hypothetical protein